MKKKEKKVNSYTAVFESAEEGGYIVHVPSLPGCATQGDTFEEAFENAIAVTKNRQWRLLPFKSPPAHGDEITIAIHRHGWEGENRGILALI